jgi:hypothetical protein
VVVQEIPHEMVENNYTLDSTHLEDYLDILNSDDNACDENQEELVDSSACFEE